MTSPGASQTQGGCAVGSGRDPHLSVWIPMHLHRVIGPLDEGPGFAQDSAESK